MSVLGELEPKKVFYYFEELTRIPHGSRNTREISDYLAAFARERGLAVWQDEKNNIVIISEATEGYEEREPIILQGHMDMVCEKEEECSIDFTRDPLDLYIDGDFVKARGTTLGGDDGIAVAYALAILDSPEIAHPRLEVVITVDEEIGMLGAADIDLSMLHGHRMLNIDSEQEGEFLTSCAGGMSLNIDIPIGRSLIHGRKVTVLIDGLQGGHSGDEIDKERANADILMGRVLRELSEVSPFGLLKLCGGNKDNAIPRSCEAQIIIPEEKMALLRQKYKEITNTIQKELSSSDPGVSLKIVEGESGEVEAADPASTGKLLFFLRMVPNGVQHMSLQIPGLVETSLNLGIMELQAGQLHAVISIRSSVASRKRDLCDKVCHLVMMVGGTAQKEGDYPAWEYCDKSPLREKITEVYEKLYGKKPIYTAIHAGLECGVLSKKIAQLDCVSFGPDMFDIHTPKERLSISSARRVWEFLIEFLRQA